LARFGLGRRRSEPLGLRNTGERLCLDPRRRGGGAVRARSCPGAQGFGRVQAVDRPLDLVFPGDHREELAAEGDPQIVHRDDVPGIGDRDHGRAQSASHRDRSMAAGERLGKNRFCAGGEGGVGQVDKPKLVLIG
jgi:hypothetical protein